MTSGMEKMKVKKGNIKKQSEWVGVWVGSVLKRWSQSFRC